LGAEPLGLKSDRGLAGFVGYSQRANAIVMMRTNFREQEPCAG